MDLRLEHHRLAAQLIEGLLRLGGSAGNDAARHRGAGRGQQLFRLIFVNLHRT